MGDWFLLKHDPETGRKVECKFDTDGLLRVRDTMPIEKLASENTGLRNDFTGWRGKKFGGVVSRIPVNVFNDLKKKCGFDGSEYDKRKMKQLLQDRDYRKFQTVTGNW